MIFAGIFGAHLCMFCFHPTWLNHPRGYALDPVLVGKLTEADGFK
jgi:hypothetical protein